MKEGWTLETLREYLSSRIDGQDRAVSAALAAAEKAIAAAMAAAEKATIKAEDAAEKRFEALNEFRGAMTDQQAGFASKESTDLRLKAIELRLADSGGRSDIIWKIIAGFASISAILALFGKAAL